ncbi:MAG: transposase, partial [Streptosporangiales bacterium]
LKLRIPRGKIFSCHRTVREIGLFRGEYGHASNNGTCSGRVHEPTSRSSPVVLGGCLQHAWPHDRAHYFFGRARWELDQLGLAIAQLAVLLVTEPGADVRVAVDDSVFRRCGRRVHGAGWQHDGSSPAMSKLSYGNCFVTAAILARLPFCSREVCLPVLARLHLPGKGAGPGKVETAAALVSLLALAFPGRVIHVVADAAYHGPARSHRACGRAS